MGNMFEGEKNMKNINKNIVSLKGENVTATDCTGPPVEAREMSVTNVKKNISLQEKPLYLYKIMLSDIHSILMLLCKNTTGNIVTFIIQRRGLHRTYFHAFPFHLK